jgi:hypothetical protein
MSKATKPPNAVKAQRAEIADMREEIHDVKREVSDLQDEIEELRGQIDGMQWTISMTLRQENQMMTSPTFVATFADGTMTRMTTNCEECKPDNAAKMKLDLGRAIAVSQAAYQSRMKRPPPALVKGHFETPPNNGDAGKILRAYTADELNGN